MVVGINDPLIRVDDVFDHQIKPCLRSRFHYIPYERSLLCQPRKYGSAQVITFYEDALAGADKSCANDGLLVLFGHRCLAFGHPWIIQHDALFAHVRNAIFEQHEYLGHDINTQAIAGAKILVDPNSELGPGPGPGPGRNVDSVAVWSGLLQRHRKTVSLLVGPIDASRL